MADIQIFNVGKLNLNTSPFLQGQGQILRALNVDRDMLGAYKKRSGYTTYLGTPDNSQVTSLFSWTQNDGATMFNYRVSNGIIYHSVGGTGDWTVSGNGTITSGAHFGYGVLDNTLIGGDGTAVTRHTTTGTDFTNTSGAPLAEHWQEYQQRMWAARGTAVAGSNTDLFYSTTGTATDWTTDSSSIRIPGPGRVNSIFKSASLNSIMPSKDSGQIFAYNNSELFDLSTNFGPSSPYSLGSYGDYKIYITNLGFMGFGGRVPEIISSDIERQIFNDAETGITGTVFKNAPGAVHEFNYYCGVGTVTDNLTYETIPDCVMRYNITDGEWVNWKFFNRPYSFHSYKDINGVQQLIFGDNGGQCYQLSGTATSDNGNPIESALVGFIHGGTLNDKKWNWIKGMFNPGCRAKVQFAISDTFTPRTLNWTDVGFAKDGVVDYRFPAESRGKFLFWKVYENSSSTPWHLYGFEFDAEVIKH